MNRCGVMKLDLTQVEKVLEFDLSFIKQTGHLSGGKI